MLAPFWFDPSLLAFWKDTLRPAELAPQDCYTKKWLSVGLQLFNSSQHRFAQSTPMDHVSLSEIGCLWHRGAPKFVVWTCNHKKSIATSCKCQSQKQSTWHFAASSEHSKPSDGFAVPSHPPSAQTSPTHLVVDSLWRYLELFSRGMAKRGQRSSEGSLDLW